MAPERQELMASQSLTLFSAKVSHIKYYCCCRDWSKLHSDLLADILCRLSDSELVRCTIICKPWNDTIVNVCIPKIFASAPLRVLAYATIPNSGLYLTFIPDAPLTRHGEIVTFKEFYRVLHSMPNGLVFRGCCNGLFLFLLYSDQQYCVCNPGTGQFVVIPVCSEVYTRCPVSLAFDPCRSPHFKLICFFAILRFIKFYIYSSETGRWDVHIIRFDDYYVEHECIKRIVYVNGILYCLSEPDLLLSVDVDHDQLKVRSIILPFNIRDNVIGFIEASRNHLCYSNCDFYYMFVWRLEGYSDAPKWVLMRRIRIEVLTSIPIVGSGCREREFLMPCALHPTSDVIFIETPKRIVAYDPHRHEAIWLAEGQFKVYPYVRCLVSLKSHKQRHCAS